jgi:hypothetical protein
MEEALFARNRNLFSSLDLVVFDTTSIYFEGQRRAHLGRKGFSKDQRPDLNQMIVGVVLDDQGMPPCCVMWPDNTTDVKTLVPVVTRLRQRFHVIQSCLVADRGMISQETLEVLEDPASTTPNILGVRMRQLKEVREEVLARAGRFQVVAPVGQSSKDLSPLKVKEVWLGGKRCIVCLNVKQAEKDAADREAILEALRDKLDKNPKGLVGNKGYRKHLKIQGGSVTIDTAKALQESRFDGKRVLQTNTKLPAAMVALKDKEPWHV